MLNQVVSKVLTRPDRRVVSSDPNVKCDSSSNLKELFEGLPLKKWEQIEFRQPYVGVVTSDGEVYEAIGAEEGSITTHLTNFVPVSKGEETGG